MGMGVEKAGGYRQAVIFPWETATSALYPGAPVPSITSPPRMISSSMFSSPDSF